eukprot:TRINITY_DN17368_c1_g1_i1.p1 TRINITY_DN17368_c1_g1~~TRINITY_DN17368_c1_g1_i1.p1  ORF type:complete len:379 (+),score=31.37 TRINITY_DN17368_c1_g1_i1:37-1137(+)
MLRGTSNGLDPHGVAKVRRGVSPPGRAKVRPAPAPRHQIMRQIGRGTTTNNVSQESSTQNVCSMNAALPRPIAGIHTVLPTTSRTLQRVFSLNSGASSIQGRRPTMEDVHSVNLNMPWFTPGQVASLSYAAVYDGHCGRHVAELASTLLPSLILSQRCFPADPASAIMQAFVSADRSIYKKIKGRDGGSTCTAALFVGNDLYIGNLGDARAVLVESTGKGMALSKDHKPNVPGERMRVEAAGGNVTFGRVGGCLAVSRAFGDFDFKGAAKVLSDTNEPMVSNIPDVTKVTLTDSCEALILACDGLWDVVSCDEAAKTVHVSLLSHTGFPLPKACAKAAEALTQLALIKGSTDNVTVVVLTLHNTIV